MSALFFVLAASFAGVAFGSIRSAAGAGGWIVGLAAAVLALWLAGLAVRSLRAR
jgi:hypothetical protein